ncbi:MAG: hypothetical protein ACKO66_11540, partial [Flavobacteriales bacterium]
MRNIILICVVSAICLTSWSQPNRLPAGCHHTHQHRRVPAMTEEQRVLMNQSIARSDTFDIASYRIDIDVTDYI